MYHDEDFTSGWNDNDILFALDQHSELDFYILLPLWNNSPQTDISLFSDKIILISSQSFFVLTP